jgi:hypothetical protein
LNDLPYTAFPDGFHPFWFWNDRISPEGVRRQVARMAQQGVKGFFIHSRQGLEQPYLSSDFLDLVELAVSEAERHGLTVHLYDEFPYPSGAAGGGVVQADPSLAGTTLCVTTAKLPAGRVRFVLPAGRLLACATVPVLGEAPCWDRADDVRDAVGMSLTQESYYEAGLQLYNDRRFFANAPAPVLETTLAAPCELWAVSSVAIATHKYWGNFPDVTNPRAVERFVEMTHERYRRHLGPVLGHLASVFVDEVEPEISSSVLAELEQRHGPRLGDVLLAYGAPSHPDHLRARRELGEVRQWLFERSFEEPIARWCHENGLRYLGEKPSVRLSQLRWMDVPGCEPGHTKAGAPRHDLLQPEIRGNAKATASAAYFYGKEGSLCECFHSLGWGATLQDAKLIAESLLLLGTRWLVPHAFFYSTRGLRKHDAPPSLLQMPYWPLFGELSSRVGAISEAFAGTVIDAAIGVVEPSGGLPTPEQLSCYEELQHRLMASHLDFLTVDTDILTAGKLEEGSVALRDVRLRAIVVPPMLEPEKLLENWLARFESRKGLVLRVDNEAGLDAVVASLADRCPPRLGIYSPGGEGSRVLSVARRGEHGYRHLLLNTASRSVVVELRPRTGNSLTAPPLAGAPGPPLKALTDGGFELCLEAFESVLVEENNHTPSRVEAHPPPPATLGISTEGRWRAKPIGPNLLRLGRWCLSLPDYGGRAAIVEPAPIANQLRHSQLPFVPRIVEHFGSSPSVELPEVRARYQAAFESAGRARLQISMEPGALAGDWSLSVDGGRPLGPDDLVPTAGPVEGCVGFQLDLAVTGATTSGRPQLHELVIDATLRSSEEGLRDSLYVVGDFAVWAPTPRANAPGERAPVQARIGEAPKEVPFGGLEDAGLPYFAGTVEYERDFELPDVGNAELVLVALDLPPHFEDALEVAFGAGRFHPVAWSPRRVLVPRCELSDHLCTVRVRLLTTLVRAFEGRWFDPAVHAYREVEPAPLPTERHDMGLA